MEEETLRGKANYILGVTIILTLMGLLMIFSTSSIVTPLTKTGMHYFLAKQGISAIIGISSIFIILKKDLKWWNKYAFLWLVLSLVLLAATLCFPNSKDTKRWLFNGQFQPSEITRVFFILYLARFFSKKEGKLASLTNGLFPPCFILSIILGILVAQPHLGMAVFFCFLTFFIFILARIRTRHIILLYVGTAIIMLSVIGSSRYAKDRVRTFVNKYPSMSNLSIIKKFTESKNSKNDKKKEGDGWQVEQAGIALGSGGLVGVGLGNSMQKLSCVPISHAEFIFSIVGEELGFLGSLSLFVLFVLFAYFGFSIAWHSQSTAGFFLAFSLTFSIILQAIINIAIVSDTIPTTGLPLPFISYGGSSLLSNLIAVGFIMNVAREK